ncbi:hypothetical protein M9H77_29511 [Catharanthus roseus]|uniref:Uncharacterized protein n=1 Tax=Catharanthus roseus TaxID=4058 RepID=A0ACB9ZVE2_CATRO|nr:hypothetical protein M9H77_29511 [Catharanthus roseus]
MELKLGPTAKPRMKKLKASNGNEDNGVATNMEEPYMEEVVENKFEGFGDQGKASKMFSICSISKDHSRKQLEGENWISIGEGKPTSDGSLTPTIIGRLLAKKG